MTVLGYSAFAVDCFLTGGTVVRVRTSNEPTGVVGSEEIATIDLSILRALASER